MRDLLALARQAAAEYRATLSGYERNEFNERTLQASRGLPAETDVRAYRDALGELYRLDELGEEADHDEARAVVNALARLTDDLGPAVAARMRAEWARRVGRCPLCGGAPHA